MNQTLATNSSAYGELVLGAFEEQKVQEAARKAREHLGGKADIAFLFVSCDLESALPDLIELVQIHGHCPRVVGCSAGGFIATGKEEEDKVGISLLFLRLPGSEVQYFNLQEYADSSEWKAAQKWNRDCTGWVLLGHPVHIGEDWMGLWNEAMGSVPTFGGLATGSHRVEDLFLFTEKGRVDAAAIAIGFRGKVRLSGLVSQGCRPIGEPFTITKAEDNVIYQLASKKAYDQLQTTFQSLPSATKERAQGNILVGLAMSEYVEDFRSGDFLVRSILGGDPNQGALAVGAMPRVGQTLQFQLRDREAADSDLRDLLQQKKEEMASAPFGGLLFCCGGRGSHLFGKPNHDAELFEQVFGALPMSGFFCNGEIGSVGHKAYVHAYTASGVFFTAPEADSPAGGLGAEHPDQ